MAKIARMQDKREKRHVRKTFNDEKMMKNTTCKTEQRKKLKRWKIDKKGEKREKY